MLFIIRLTIGDEISGKGFYANSSNPSKPVSKHMADGITINRRWISRAITENWHTAQVTELPKQIAGNKKSAAPARYYA